MKAHNTRETKTSYYYYQRPGWPHSLPAATSSLERTRRSREGGEQEEVDMGTTSRRLLGEGRAQIQLFFFVMIITNNYIHDFYAEIGISIYS
jgi:hypothetical protein